MHATLRVPGASQAAAAGFAACRPAGQRYSGVRALGVPGSVAASGSGAERPGAPPALDALITQCAARAAVLAPAGVKGRVGGTVGACGWGRRTGADALPRGSPTVPPEPV